MIDDSLSGSFGICRWLRLRLGGLPRFLLHSKLLLDLESHGVRIDSVGLGRCAEIGEIGTRLALHPHVAKIGIDGIADLRLRHSLGFGLGGSDQAVADGAKLDCLAAGFIDRVFAFDRDAATLAAFPPVDIVGAFGVNLNLAVDPYLVFEPAIRLGDDGREAPASIHFDLLD